MAIKEKYLNKIVYDYTESPKSRTWDKLVGGKASAQVSHDTGNPGSTAKGNANYFKSTTKGSSSAHSFIDDKEIRIIIPLDEKAWHVQYGKTTDNRIWGDDANDIALGHELCWGGSIDFEKAYDMYVWFHVYCAKKYGIPLNRIEGHFKLDPERRTDPVNAFKRYGKTWSGFLADVKNYFDNWEGSASTGSHKDEVVHTIQKGDTLWSIAREHDVSVGALEKMNPGVDAKTLEIGSKLTVKEVENTPKPEQPTIAADPETTKKPNIPPLPSGVFSEKANSGKYSTGTKQIQTFLNAIYFKCGTPDGYFGPKTEDALKRFQSMYSALKVDGIYGPNTRTYMIKKYNELY